MFFLSGSLLYNPETNQSGESKQTDGSLITPQGSQEARQHFITWNRFGESQFIAFNMKLVQMTK